MRWLERRPVAARIAVTLGAAGLVGLLTFAVVDGGTSGRRGDDAALPAYAEAFARTTFVAVGDVMASDADAGLPLWTDVRAIFRGINVLVAARPGRAFVLAPSGAMAQEMGRAALVEGTPAQSMSRTPHERLDAQTLAVATGSRLEQRLETERPVIATKGGLRFVTLSFADPLDVRTRRASRAWPRRLDLDPALRSLRDARRVADVVVVSVRWGDELQSQPTARQRRIARRFVEAGADLVVGHLPKVVQPIEILQVGGRRAVVAYSLGGAAGDTAGQGPLRAAARSDRRDSAALEVTFAKVRADAERFTTIVEDVSYESLWTVKDQRAQQAGRRARVVPIESVAAGVLRRLDDTAVARASASGTALRTATRKLLELQEQFRSLTVRKERIESVLGEEERLKDALRGVKKAKP